ETSYQQRAQKYREIDLSFSLNPEVDLFGKIDFYDAIEKVVHEIKRSDKMETAHEWQVKFYLYLLELNGVGEVKAILEYPKARSTNEVTLSQNDKEYLETVFSDILEITRSENCPPRINS